MYHLRDRVGRWGVGEIYNAVHKGSGKLRMLKIVRGRKAEDPDVRARFAHEMEVTQKIDHPFVLKPEALMEDPVLGIFLVMEPMKGETLADFLSKGMTFLVPKAASLIKKIAEAVLAAHLSGVVHGELCPDTVFLKKDDYSAAMVPLLTGFGLPPRGAGKRTTLPLEAMPYGAPERKQAGKWEIFCDIYSICALFVHLLAGQQPPPQGWNKPPQLPRDATGAGREFLALAFKGMEKNPANRFSSLTEFLNELNELINDKNLKDAPTQTAPSLRKRKSNLQIKRRTPPPPLPTNGKERRKKSFRKTIMGVGAVQATTQSVAKTSTDKGVTIKGKGGKSPLLTKTQELYTKPNSSPADVPLPPQPPPPKLRNNVEPTEGKLALVSSEAATDDVGTTPLEPEVFNGRTGSVPAVDSGEIKPLENATAGSAKSSHWWIWLLLGLTGSAALALAAFILKPWNLFYSENEKITKPKHETVMKKTQIDAGVSFVGDTLDGGSSKVEGDAGSKMQRVDATLVDAGEDRIEDAEVKEVAESELDGGDGDDGDEKDKEQGDSQSMTDMDRYSLYLRQGRRAMRHNRYKLARRQFTKALKIKRSSHRGRIYMGLAHYRAKEYWAAVHWFKKALKVSPRSASTNLWLAKAYIKVKKKNEACKHFNRAFKLRPNSKTYRRYVENYRCR